MRKLVCWRFQYLVIISYKKKEHFLFNLFCIYTKCLSKTHFIKILHNPSHPLFKRLVVNNSRTSSRRPNTFRTAKAKTVAYSDSFFQSQMKLFNNFCSFFYELFHSSCNFWYFHFFVILLSVNIQFYQLYWC